MNTRGRCPACGVDSYLRYDECLTCDGTGWDFGDGFAVGGLPGDAGDVAKLPGGGKRGHPVDAPRRLARVERAKSRNLKCERLSRREKTVT